MVYFDQMTEFKPFFANNLITWYQEHKRDLPWRHSMDPYRIWLSEIILQQTRVSQGMPYYLKFLEAFPTVEKLAEAPETKVLKLWQGLGYYSRARNLHATAKTIANDRKGVFPDNYTDLVKLKGIGDYTASAIASICFNEAAAVVDGNVFRVLSRVFGISTPINTSSGQKKFKKLAKQLIDLAQPGTYNQALMEFGSLYCVPKNPDCENCIYRYKCSAFQNDKVGELPRKLKAKPSVKRYFNYVVLLSDNRKTFLEQRQEKGIWHKLYEFPLIESSNKIDLEMLKSTTQFKEITKDIEIKSVVLYNEKSVLHKLSHQNLYARFWIVEILESGKNFLSIPEIEEYAVPVLIDNFVSEFFEKY